MEIFNGNYCVYCHINKVNGKKYVGITKHGEQPNKRWADGKGYYRNKYFYSAIQKYGWENFEHYIIASNLTESEAYNFERILIVQLHSNNKNFGYNLDNGGTGPGSLSEETKKKISNSHKGAPIGIGHEITEETKKKISASLKGRKSVWKTQTKKKISKPVSQFSIDGKLIATYYGIREAERQTGIAHSTIANCCRGKNKTAGGFIWKHVNEEDYSIPYNRKRKVNQFSLDGEFIAQYESIKEASEKNKH